MDLAPELGSADLAGLAWEDSADYTSTLGLTDGSSDLSAEDLAQLDAEVEALLTAERRAADPTTSALGSWSDEAIVAEAARLERVGRFAAGRGLELVHELAQRRPEVSGAPGEAGLSGYAVEEISLAAGITRYAACHRVAEADTLHTRFPRLLAATKAGLVTGYALSAVLEATVELSPELCTELETRLLSRAGRGVVDDLAALRPEQLAALSDEAVMAVSVKASRSWMARVARDLTNRLDPTAAARKRQTARKGRRISVEHGPDAMSWLSVYGPTARIQAAYDHIDDLARHEPDPTDGRTLDAKRADVAIDLLHGAGTTTDGEPIPPVPVNLHLTIDHTTNHDGSTQPGEASAELGGVGPIDTDTRHDLFDLARETAGVVDGTYATDQPCPGPDVHDSEGPGPYVPNEKLKAYLRVKHRVCIFPGCQRAARRCHLDHTRRYPEGPTCSCNLAPLCVRHHLLKHHAPGWQLTNHGHGHLTWTTPTGQHLHTVPDHHDGDDDVGQDDDPAPPSGSPPDDDPPS